MSEVFLQITVGSLFSQTC